MIKNSLVQSFVPVNFIGGGLMTRERVRGRAHELALRAGRFSWQVTQSDYEQATQELMGEYPARRDVPFNSAPETKGKEPQPGSGGYQSVEPPTEGEDAESRSETAQPVAGGVEIAEREQIHQARVDVSRADRAER